ncbi:MAG: hypothetical protein M1816_007655 [Peltula sp. TS41687]|nr:MAG: hypothetical protein M1816_007655 [Peltula sp. TS41687]
MALPINALLNPVPEGNPPSTNEMAMRPRNKLHVVVNALAQVPSGGQDLQRPRDRNGAITPSPTDSGSSQETHYHGQADTTPTRNRFKRGRHEHLVTPPQSDELEARQEGAETLASISQARFNIFGAIVSRPDLLVEFTTQLDVEDLISLYAISRDFHQQVDSRFTTVIMAQARAIAPESAQVFHFKAYKSFCMPDPAMRPHPRLANEIRLIPSFRWLRMIMYRERVVTEIISLLANDNLTMPARASLTLKRLWLTLDIPTNAKRIGLMHNADFWTDVDLYLAMLFGIRLDMAFNHPNDSYPSPAMRNLLLGQRSLSLLWEALSRTVFLSHLEVAQYQLRCVYVPEPRWLNTPAFGVQPSEFSSVSRDASSSTSRLLRIDELVEREMERRELPRDTELVYEMILWGSLDLEKLAEESEDEGEGEGEGALEGLPAGVAQLGMA